jgi:hypothetical protein
MRIYRALLGLAAALSGAPALSAAQPSKESPKSDVRATAPRNGDGDNLLRSLCSAIREIANGARELSITPPRSDPTQPAETKLWRNANGTAIDIDFGGGWVGAAVIARLLSGSVFIPTDRIDLVVIHHAKIRGSLDLSNATIEVAVSFEDVRFNPGDDGSCDTKQPRDSQHPSEAIILADVHAKKRVTVLDSQVCGDFRISGSRLDGGLKVGTKDHPDNDGYPHNPSELAALLILKSALKSDTFINSTRVGQYTRLDRSTVDSITIVDVQFIKQVDIVDNTIGAFSSWRTTFYNDMQITNNRFEAQLNLSVVAFLDDSTPIMRNNNVNGNFRMTIRNLGALKQIDLSYNKVWQASDIWLPKRWRGILNLNNTVFDSVLSLCLAEFDSDRQTLRPSRAEATKEGMGTCGNPPAHKSELFIPMAMASPSADAQHQDGTDYAVINLKSAKVGSLAWGLPMTCSFRWDGNGLRYDNWAGGGASRAASSEDQCPIPIRPIQGLMRMRRTMVEKDVDALDTMADYLASRGAVVESRNVREEANTSPAMF